MRGLGLDLSDADIAGVFNELDADGSGVMELKEFLNKIKVRVRVRVRVGLGLGLGREHLRLAPGRRLRDALVGEPPP